MSGNAGKNYSSKLRQEREGAANKLHAERAGKASDKLSEHSTAISQGTKSAVHAIQKADQTLNDKTASTDNNAGTSAAESAAENAEGALETAENLYDGHNRRQLKKALQASDFAEISADAAGNTGRKSVKTAGNAIQETAGKTEISVKKITDVRAGAVKTTAQKSTRGSGKAAMGSGKKLREAGSRTGEAVSAGFHGAVNAANEDDNVGVRSADAAAEGAENTLRTAKRVQYSAKLRSRKKAAVSDVRKSSAASGYYSASPYSRWRQKQDLKRMYAARREGASASAGVSAKRSAAAEKAEALTDTEFANMIAEAEKYIGMAYVWGGSSPSTGFDCSGFVCWVINNCGNGWYVGRTTANGLLSYCTVVSEDELQPGDLVFFDNTYSTTGASHVGIYVGDGMMIHCGDPVSYTSIETSYWQSHLLCYGRLNQ